MHGRTWHIEPSSCVDSEKTETSAGGRPIPTQQRYQQHYYFNLHNCYDVVYFRDTNTHPFNGPFSGTTQVSRYQKGKTNLDFTEAKDSEWQWHQLGHMQVSTSLQTDNHTSTPPLSFLQA